MNLVPAASIPREPWLLYDGCCPFCSRYVRWVRLRESLPELRLVDARTGGPELDLVRKAGLDADRGMVLALDGQLHHGDRCIHALALMTSPVGMFNRLNRMIFSSPWLARLSYPVLRAGRGIALTVLGRPKTG